MARYTVQIETPRTPEDAFAFMADLRNFASWDPGVAAVRQVVGSGPGPDAVYELDLRVGPTTPTWRYSVRTYEEGRRLTVAATQGLLSSVDEVTVEPTDAGSLVTYDAVLTLRGPLALLDPFLGPVFRPIGDRAAAGLRRELGVTGG